MIDLASYGPIIRDPKTWNPLIVVRHGILSDRTKFASLETWLHQQFPNATLDNNSYAWKDSVLVNGARLAALILRNYDDERDLILIGHSMGGLVCRVAACFLQNKFQSLSAIDYGYLVSDVREIQRLSFRVRRLNGLVTLGTPNSGAMLHGQLNGFAALLKQVVNLTTGEGIYDLTTDRLFRVLQKYSVGTKVLSVSGSHFNGFSLVSGQLRSWLNRGGIRLDLPHDGIVEDRSVDLTHSILPNELMHLGTSSVRHLRAYENCTDIHHTNIYDDLTVRKYVADFMCRC